MLVLTGGSCFVPALNESILNSAWNKDALQALPYEQVRNLLAPGNKQAVLVSGKKTPEGKPEWSVGFTTEALDGILPELDDALVYLGVGQSAEDAKLLQLFKDKGAGAVFANTGSSSIGSYYNRLMTHLILQYMSGRGARIEGGKVMKEVDETLHTTGEALLLTGQHLADLVPGYTGSDFLSVNGELEFPSDARVISTGAAEYTLLSGLVGKIAFDDTVDTEKFLIWPKGAAEGIKPEADGSFAIMPVSAGNIELSFKIDARQIGSHTAEVLPHRITDAGTIEVTDPQASQEWTCVNGHGPNTGDTCAECGAAKPVCPTCGYLFADGKVWNFCPHCGTKLNEQ